MSPAQQAGPEPGTPLLFAPLMVRGVTLPNRIMVSPMCTYSSDADGRASDFHLVHAGRFALGGAGLVVLEATAVEPRGRISDRDLGLWDDSQVAPLRRIADFLAEHGAVPGIQLGHAGRRGNSPPPWDAWFPHPGPAQDQWPVVAPSAEAPEVDAAVPAELTRAEIGATVANWASAARRAVEAGFRWIEIHSAHGYLIHTFLSPLANHRLDEYGGSPENRMRFGLEVAGAIRAAVGDDVALAFRISAVDGTPEGLQIEDSEIFVRELVARGVDVIDTSSGGIRTGSADPAKVRRGFAFHAPYSSHLRDTTGALIATVGLIVDGRQAEAILQAGDADIVAIGREMLVNPNWAHVAEGQLTARGYREWPRQFGWYLEARQRTLEGLRAAGEDPLSRYADGGEAGGPGRSAAPPAERAANARTTTEATDRSHFVKTTTDAYAHIVDLGSSKAGVGGMLITTLDPGDGDELSYVRWYEDDHFISGAMVWPWVFAGKRWVATRDLKALRQPASSDLVDPDTRISFFHTYLISDGHVGDVEDYGAASLERLESEQRMHWEIGRKHVYTNFEDFVGAAYADGFEARAQHSLDYPFKSTVLEVIDAPSPADRDRLCEWVLNERAPQVLAHGFSMCLVLTPRLRKLKGGGARALHDLPPESDARVTVVWLSDLEPAVALTAGLSDEADAVHAAGVGELQLVMPFRPAIHGTSAYAAEL